MYVLSIYSWDTYWGLLAALSIVGLACAILKVLVGRPRPNYYALRLVKVLIVTSNSCNRLCIDLYASVVLGM
jgi:hypothetical protein